MTFEYRNPMGDRLAVAKLDGTDSVWFKTSPQGTFVPADRVEEVVAGIRDAARQAARQTTACHPADYEGECPCTTGCGCCKAAPQAARCACGHPQGRHNTACAQCPCIGFAETWPPQIFGQTAHCGLAHPDYPETLCTRSQGHGGRHAGGFILYGKQVGGASWVKSSTPAPAVEQPAEAQPADRAAVLREAADAIAAHPEAQDEHMGGMDRAADVLRRMAEEQP